MIKDKTGITKTGIFIIGALLFLGFIALSVLVIAETSQQSLQDELTALENNLSNSGYSWLINYSITYPQVSVFRQNSQDEIANFNINDYNNNSFNKYQIFLENLSEGESYSTFDLRSFGDVERVPLNILKMKLEADGIRDELNNFKYVNNYTIE